MDEIKQYLENWLNALSKFSYANYENLPEIDLYMDQVINYLERQLQIFSTSSTDKQITPSMINNYVKGELVASPIKKRYNREHLAAIEEICTLKQVLSIAEVKQIIEERYSESVEKDEIFNSFNELNKKEISDSVNEAFKKLNSIDEVNKKEMINMALEFALTANAYINISKRILYYIRTLKNKDELAKKDKQEDKSENE